MGLIWNEFNAVGSQVEEVKDIIRKELEKSPDYIRKPLLDMVSSNAKYLRSGFMLLASSFGKASDRERLYRFAAVIEMFHLATLIHDDVIDDAKLRRNSPSIHAAYGKRIAVLTGDYLFLKCYNIISSYVDFPLVDRLSKLGLRICAGEISQAEDLYNPGTGVISYIKRITAKTASLFAFSFYLGAQEAGCGDELKNRLSKIGLSFGICFQIIDDILDFTKTNEQIGKNAQSDIIEGIYTLPVIIALKKDRKSLTGLLKKKDIGRISEMIIGSGALKESEILAGKYNDRALKLIRELPDIEAKEILIKSVSKLLKREF